MYMYCTCVLAIFAMFQKYITCFEYVRTITALAGIREAELAPLELPKMEEQCRLFNELFRAQAQNKLPEVYDNCELLDYDGK